MKLCVFLLIIITSGIVLLLPALGNFWHRRITDMVDIEQCWVQPTPKYCRKKCTKTRECLLVNHTCCWTYCGEICMDNGEPFTSLLDDKK
ncbi:protein WFDC9-like [Sorex fumeus]|uniref:protein WFDC9-like n=1 Tax=Sorex fumeus TaxID=62283 RepID=UPI0024AD5632|nr:protein WFDC9-like [Sorex fumeus]